MKERFDDLINILRNSLMSIDENVFNKLVEACIFTIKNRGKIVATGIGKNIPICEKFIATLNSFGINAIYLNPIAAFHGDIGVIGKNDIVILVTKSGETSELCNLYSVLNKRNCPMWLLTFNKKSSLSLKIENSLVILLEHEGDMWNIVPNNSTVISLIILQELALSIAKRLNINISTFKENHPGGYIGGNIINE